MASFGVLGAFWGGGLDFSVLGSLLEPLLGPSWGLLVRLGRHLGRLGGPLGPFRGRLGSLVGRLGAVLGASWAVLERPEAEKARTQKTSKQHMTINDFGLLGPSSEAFWRPLGAAWRPLGPSWEPSWASSGDLSATRGRLGPSWEPLGTLWAPLGASGARHSHAGRRQEQKKTPGGTPRAPVDMAILVPGPFKDSSGPRTGAQGTGQRT